jgi:hypothetical protein
MDQKRKKLRFNYKKYWKDNIDYMTGSDWEFSRKKAIRKQIFFTIRFFFRWNFNGRVWKPVIILKKPEWIKGE